MPPSGPHPRKTARWRRLASGLLQAGMLTVLGILICNAWVVEQTEARNFQDINRLPAGKVGLVLGTSRYIAGKKPNLFFDFRIKAAARLYHARKVQVLWLSGNNDSEFYNEPADMKAALMKLGVPAAAIRMDYAGRRTYDSIIRSREVFRIGRLTIISQAFHNARALFLARKLGIDAVAYAAPAVPFSYSPKTYFREYLARPKAVLDVYLLRPGYATDNAPIERKSE